MIEDGSIQILILGKRIDSIVTFRDNVVVQPFFKVACTISLLFASHEVITVIIHIFLNKTVNEFCLTAKFGVLDHGVDDVLTLLRIVLTIRIEVGNEFQDISHIDNITMQQFQTKIHIVKPSCSILNRIWLTKHNRTFLRNLITAWFFSTLGSKGIVYVKILAAEVHKLLFCHSEVGSILLKLIIDLNLCVFFDDVTESKDKLLLIVLTLQIIHKMSFWIMLHKSFVIS